MKDFMRICLVLIAAGLLGACGGGGEAGMAANTAPAPVDTTITLDATAWDQSTWAE